MMANRPPKENPTSRYGSGTAAASSRACRSRDAVGAGVAAGGPVAAAHVQAVVGADPGLAGQLGVDRLDIGAVAAQAMEVHDGRRPRGRGALTAQVELVATDVEGGVELADGRRLGCRRWRGRRAVGVVAGA
jgi:hypothetical protein